MLVVLNYGGRSKLSPHLVLPHTQRHSARTLPRPRFGDGARRTDFDCVLRTISSLLILPALNYVAKSLPVDTQSREGGLHKPQHNIYIYFLRRKSATLRV